MIAFSYHKDCIGPKPEKRLISGDTRETLWIGNKKINLGYGWITAELEFEDIYEMLSAGGYAFAPALTCDHRIEENFVSHELALVDIDSGMTLDQLQQHPFYRAYGSGYYTTASHTDAEPKFRILYRLPTPVTDPDNMRLIYEGLLAVHGEADIACKDAVRLFYGSLNAQHREITDRMIDADGLQVLVDARNAVLGQQITQETEFKYEHREFESKSAEQVGELLDELKKHYPDLNYGTRSVVTWAVMREVGGPDAVALMRQRWNDSNKTNKYEFFISSSNTAKREARLGTIYHMIRQHNPYYARKQAEDKISQATGEIPWFANPTIPVEKIWAFHEKKTLRKSF